MSDGDIPVAQILQAVGQGGLDGDQMQQFMDNVDQDKVESRLTQSLDQLLTPHLQDIRQRAQQGPSRHEVRQQLEAMSEEQQDQKFHQQAADLVAIAEELRTRPISAMSKLKTRIRDPWVTEALLLILSNDQHIDPQYSDEMKEFATTIIRWIGMNLCPEAYTRQEAEELVSKLYPGTDPEEILGPPPSDGGTRNSAP